MAKTGPNTAVGKLAVSKNSFKHGIASADVVIEGHEDRKEWEGIRDGIIESFDPPNTIEHMFCERIAISLWKLRRFEVWQTRKIVASVAGVESGHRKAVETHAAFTAQGYASDGPQEYDPEYVDFWQKFQLVPDQKQMELNMRYEAHLHRQYIQTLHELEAMQTRRKGGRSPLARFDVTGSPGG